MKSNNIKRIVNCTKNVPNFFIENGIQYFQIPMDDISEDADILKNKLLLALNFMKDPSENDGVLVHCMAGISRSCTVVAAFLRFHYFANLNDSFNFIRSFRPIAFDYGRRFDFLNVLTFFFEK
jgi:dual specificity phosphatase 12